MREIIRCILIFCMLISYFIVAITIEMLNWIPFTFFFLGVACWMIAYYMPEKKQKKATRRRQLYTDWDACYDIATRK